MRAVALAGRGPDDGGSGPREGHVVLSVTEAGAGGRPLLAVHGFTGAKEDFGDHVGALAAEGWHVVAPDLRGHGASTHPPGSGAYHPDRLVADLVDLLDALGWPSAVVVGHSLGSALAQRLVLEHPARVAGLVLVAPFHGPLTTLDPGLVALGEAVVRSGGLAALAQAMDAHRGADPAAVAARARLEAAEPGYAERRHRQLVSCSADMWLALAPRFCTWPDTLAAMAAVRVPTLVMVGSEDEAMGPQARALAEAVPGARLEVLEGAAHSPQVEDAEGWRRRLVAYLRDAGLAPGGPGGAGDRPGRARR